MAQRGGGEDHKFSEFALESSPIMFNRVLFVHELTMSNTNLKHIRNLFID